MILIDLQSAGTINDSLQMVPLGLFILVLQ